MNLELMDMKHGMATLLVAGAKRIIAKEVTALPQTHKTLPDEMVIIPGDTTNAYGAEKLTGWQWTKFAILPGLATQGFVALPIKLLAWHPWPCILKPKISLPKPMRFRQSKFMRGR